METNETTILHELLSLQKESNERDTRIESKMDSMDFRMEIMEKHSAKQDEQIEKLTEILADQKDFASNVEMLKSAVKHNSAKILEHEEKINQLQNKSGKLALDIWKKIGTTALTVVVTSLVTYLIAKFIGK